MADGKSESAEVSRVGRYREKIQALRAFADTIKNPDAQRELRSIAADYELLVEYLENLPNRQLP
jgi:hypothetical protein